MDRTTTLPPHAVALNGVRPLFTFDDGMPRPTSCDIVAQANLSGPLPISVFAHTPAATRSRRGYIAIRISGLLVYVHDREALVSIVAATHKAHSHAAAVFGPLNEADMTETAMLALRWADEHTKAIAALAERARDRRRAALLRRLAEANDEVAQLQAQLRGC